MNTDEIWRQFNQLKIEEKQIKNNEDEDEEDDLQCYCKSSNAENFIETADGDLVCNNCGKILQSRVISHEAEWRNFDNDMSSFGISKDNNRCGSSQDAIFPVYSQKTYIRGNTKLSQMHSWLSFSYEEKKIYQIKLKINSLIIENNYSLSLCSPTINLYKQFSDLNKTDTNYVNFRGINNDSILAVCFYYATINLGLNISTDMISRIFKVPTKNFNKGYQIYNETINVKNISSVLNNDITDISRLFETYLNKLEISFIVQKLCKNIMDVSCDLGIFTNMSYRSIIASIIHFVVIELNLNIDKKDICILCQISSATIIKGYNILLKKKTLIFSLIKEKKQNAKGI